MLVVCLLACLAIWAWSYYRSEQVLRLDWWTTDADYKRTVAISSFQGEVLFARSYRYDPKRPGMPSGTQWIFDRVRPFDFDIENLPFRQDHILVNLRGLGIAAIHVGTEFKQRDSPSAQSRSTAYSFTYLAVPHWIPSSLVALLLLLTSKKGTLRWLISWVDLDQWKRERVDR